MMSSFFHHGRLVVAWSAVYLALCIFISDTVLHFGYNAIATTALAATFLYVLRDRQRRAGRVARTVP